MLWQTTKSFMLTFNQQPKELVYIQKVQSCSKTTRQEQVLFNMLKFDEKF